MIQASIDIGTNTVLLLVAENNKGQKLNIIYEDQRTPRLGKGVDKERNLHKDSIGRVLKAVNEYQQILALRFPEAADPVVTATSAVRDSNNRNDFIERMFRETGIRATILDGDQEARYTYKGALSVLSGVAGPVAVLDIGGGSTEIATGKGLNPADCFSFDVGSVRYTERYLVHSPPAAEQLNQCRTAVRDVLSQRSFEIPDETVMIGVAGTVTSLAFMESGFKEYDSSSLNGVQLTLKQVAKWVEKLKEWSSGRLLQEYPEVMEGRADVFLAGLLILEGFMEIYGFDKLLVSTGGIRHGAILSTEI